MDGRRFDEMARALGAGASRRRVLAGLAGGALAVLFRGQGRAQESAAACAAILCETNTKCCDVCGQGTCVPIDQPCPLAACVGEPCGTSICGPGEFCCNESCGICAPIGGFCTAQFCGAPGDGGFAERQGVVTTDALNYRAAPGLGAAVLTVLPAGTLGVVFNGPVPADGYAWYQVGVEGYGPGGATPGWVAGEFLAAT